MFVHKAEFINEEDKEIVEELEGREEGKDYLKFEWIDLKQIDNYDLRPVAVKEMLKNNKIEPHKVQIG